MIDEIETETKAAMEDSIESLKKMLGTIRAGRATPALLDQVRVDYYGSKTPLSQVASVQVADATLLIVKPWEKGILKEVEKGIVEANLGFSPSNDGDVVRVPIPPLSEDRRKEYAKAARGRCEDAKVAVRNARRDGNELIKGAKKEGEISEDDEKRGLKVIQDLTDAYISRIDDLYAKKESEILEV